MVKAPKGMSDEALAVFDTVTRSLHDSTILENTPVLLEYTETFALWANAMKIAREHGTVVKQGNKFVESPFYVAANRLERKLAGIRKEHVSDVELNYVEPEDDQSLTEKIRQFIKEYLIDKNGYKAALRAGYTIKSSRNKATELLGKDSVKRHIRVQMARIHKQIGFNIVVAREGLLLEARGLGPDTNSSARNQAWQLLCKLDGLFQEDRPASPGGEFLDNMSPEEMEVLEVELTKQLYAKKQEQPSSH